MNKIELLSPAGDFEKLKVALKFGADAVYIGGEEFSLRAAAANFDIPGIERAAEFTHNLGKKLYLTANIIPHNADIFEFEKYLKEIKHINLDAIIVSDLGMFDIVRETMPDTAIHISTQANNTNHRSAAFWHKLGAKRVIIARELSFEEIMQTREKIPAELELEAFVHGAMCISYSGRCLLSNYMTNRDGNAGNCAQPCRWNYYLMEEMRPGEYMPVFENQRGTYIYNSKDLCMIEYADKLIESGLSSLKIEGRVKNEYYVATVTSTYRAAIDEYYNCKLNGTEFKTDPNWLIELKKVSHRDYTTGFYFNRPAGEEQHYHSSSYIREYDLVGIVADYDKENNVVSVLTKNRFFKGDTVEFLRPFGKFYTLTVEEMWDADGNAIDVANKPQSIVKIKTDCELEPDSVMRKARNP